MKVKELLYEGAKLRSLNCMYSCITKELWKDASSPWNERVESSNFMSLWPFFGCLEELRSNASTAKATECDTSVVSPPFWGLGLEHLFRNVSLLVRVVLHRHVPVCLLGNPVSLSFVITLSSSPGILSPRMLLHHLVSTATKQGVCKACGITANPPCSPQLASCLELKH